MGRGLSCWRCLCRRLGVRVSACRARFQSSLEAVKKPGVEGSDRPRNRLNNPMSSPVSKASRVRQPLTAPVLRCSHLAR